MTKANNTGNLEMSISYAGLPSVLTEANGVEGAEVDHTTLSPETLDVVEEYYLIDKCDAATALEVVKESARKRGGKNWLQHRKRL